MARTGNRKKKFVLKIEIGAKGLLATGVVIFCVLLWMFLLGIWAADHLAGEPEETPVAPFPSPARVEKGPAAPGTVELPAVPPARPRTEKTAPAPEPVRERVSLVPRAEKKRVRSRAGKAPAGASGGKAAAGKGKAGAAGSFFSLQVGAYRNKANAVEDCARYVARGLDAFFREPARAGAYTRVYVGRYRSMDEARAASRRLEKEKGIRSFVVMIPGRDTGK